MKKLIASTVTTLAAGSAAVGAFVWRPVQDFALEMGGEYAINAVLTSFGMEPLDPREEEVVSTFEAAYARVEMVLRRTEAATRTHEEIDQLEATARTPGLQTMPDFVADIESRLGQLRGDVEEDRTFVKRAIDDLIRLYAKDDEAVEDAFKRAASEAANSASFQTLDVINALADLVRGAPAGEPIDTDAFASYWRSYI